MIVMLGWTMDEDEPDHKSGWALSSKGGRHSAVLISNRRVGSPATPRDVAESDIADLN